MPQQQDGLRWRTGVSTDAYMGGTSSIRIRPSSQHSLEFDFRLTDSATFPFVAGELVLDDEPGNALGVDLTKYNSISFVAKCAPANSLQFSLPAFEPGLSKRGNFYTYPAAGTFFSCTERGTPVSLALSRLIVPQWWYNQMKIEPSRQAVNLRHVAKVMFAIGPHSPRNTDAHVEISELELHGRDFRYLWALGVFLVLGWGSFGIWFLRAHSRALVASLESQLKSDMPFVAYRQLTLEPFKDKEKAAILEYIGNHFADPDLDIGSVVTRIGAGRDKINEILKTELGMTFTGYVNKLRLTEAARMLSENTGKPIAEIAYSVGYAHVSYFNKLFKDEYGCTPKVFRTLAGPSPSLGQPEPGSPSNPPVDEVRA